MAYKKSRNLKVHGMNGYRYRPTPAILLRGQWLSELGFDIGGYVSVSCENGRLVITPDMDSQSNLTTCFGTEEVKTSIGDLMMNVIDDEELPESEEFILERNGVDYIPSTMGLSAVEAKLRMEMGTERILSAILEPLRGDYDYILIDTSPFLGALNINAMVAADEVIVTVNPQLLAMKGLQDFLKTVKKIKSRINERLEVAGILLTMCD